MDERLTSKIRLTPAERIVLLEQAENAKVALDDFIDGVDRGVVDHYFMAWGEVDNCRDYIHQILNSKAAAAMHACYREDRD